MLKTKWTTTNNFTEEITNNLLFHAIGYFIFIDTDRKNETVCPADNPPGRILKRSNLLVCCRQIIPTVLAMVQIEWVRLVSRITQYAITFKIFNFKFSGSGILIMSYTHAPIKVTNCTAEQTVVIVMVFP